MGEHADLSSQVLYKTQVQRPSRAAGLIKNAESDKRAGLMHGGDRLCTGKVQLPPSSTKVGRTIFWLRGSRRVCHNVKSFYDLPAPSRTKTKNYFRPAPSFHFSFFISIGRPDDFLAGAQTGNHKSNWRALSFIKLSPSQGQPRPFSLRISLRNRTAVTFRQAGSSSNKGWSSWCQSSYSPVGIPHREQLVPRQLFPWRHSTQGAAGAESAIPLAAIPL